MELRTSLNQRLEMRPSSPPPNIQEEATQAILQQIVSCLGVRKLNPVWFCFLKWCVAPRFHIDRHDSTLYRALDVCNEVLG